MAREVLKGSERKPMAGARALGKCDPSERFEVTVLLRHRSADQLRAGVAKIVAGDASGKRLSREEFGKQHGASAADLEAVRRFAHDFDLLVVHEDAARRAVVLSGTVAKFNAAFGVDLEQFEHDDGTYRGRTGPILLPGDLAPSVEAVLGLDDRPVARPHLRARSAQERAAPNAQAGTFDPTQLAKLYGFPAGNGTGQSIAIIELGGGYRTTDLSKYFSELGVAKPKVTAVSIDHAKNRPTGSANGPDGEVMLDIEVAGAIAPGANIVVYFAPNTDAGFLDAISTAIHDTTHKPSVVSISWGGPESTWTSQSLTAYDAAFQSAVLIGVTVCVASGDSGSGDGVSDGSDHVDFPASSPHVLACGGTSLKASASAITSETVWNDGAAGGATGGGISSFFAVPAWQSGLKATRANGSTSTLTKRGVPDVSADADPQTGYQVRVDGKESVFGGTSAVAPLWAALVARINAEKGTPIGFANTKLYKNHSAFRDITNGNNGDFLSARGWDACTGLGSPVGTKIAALF
ncbi:MAG TPA: S53 family peptidase [Burkholderiaceae bacterium]|nr:S53 family peptidase [Burkholderiaceae bacterium]